MNEVVSDGQMQRLIVNALYIDGIRLMVEIASVAAVMAALLRGVSDRNVDSRRVSSRESPL